MSNTELGKKFEAFFAKNWSECFPNTFVYRLKDQMTGYLDTSKNPGDFLCFNADALFMVECKEHEGASIPFTAIPQYERLLKYKGLNKVVPGILIWFSEKDIEIWVGIEEAEKMVNNGEKSIGLRMLNQKDASGNLLYNIIVVQTEKKRLFLEANYNKLVEDILNGC